MIKKYNKNSQFSLATRSRINKYLTQVDNNRYYSNFGPLYFKLKKKIEKHLNYKNNGLILTSSGHSSLLAVTKYLRTKLNKKYVLCPSFSFYSNPLSIIDSGFKPYFVDISSNDLVINFKLVKQILSKKKDIAFLMVVSPFGHPIDIDYLNKFQKLIKIPIVYDAADAFLNLKKKINNQIFITCSFHPTKTLGANESGLIISPNKHTKTLENIINFGLKNKNSVSNSIGFNGKFSEYDAAIFLANFDEVASKTRYLKKRLKIFFKYFPKKYKIVNYEKTITNKINFYTNPNKIYAIRKLFLKHKIILNKWWSEKSMHEVNIFKKYPKTKMYWTNLIKKNIYGFYIDHKMSTKKIKNFCNEFSKL